MGDPLLRHLLAVIHHKSTYHTRSSFEVDPQFKSSLLNFAVKHQMERGTHFVGNYWLWYTLNLRITPGVPSNQIPSNLVLSPKVVPRWPVEYIVLCWTSFMKLIKLIQLDHQRTIYPTTNLLQSLSSKCKFQMSHNY